MGQYDTPLKYKVVIKALKKLGLELKGASNHQTATHSSGRKTTIPRHSELNKFIVGSIIEFLLACGESEDDIRTAFKLKK